MVLWSGGLDSTWALHRMLDCWHNAGTIESKQGKPETLTITSTQVHNIQRKMEIRARVRLKKLFKKKFGWEFKSKEVVIDSNNHYHGGLAQATLWITNAVMAINAGQPLVLGWVKGDDALTALDKLTEVWKILVDLNNKDNSTLWIPGAHKYKEEIIEELRNLELLEACWWCENPFKQRRKYVACGTCHSCQRMVSAHAVDLTRKAESYEEAIAMLS